jgi:DNA-binding GntR family transcriptional regulator
MEIKSVPKIVVEYLRDRILVGQLAPHQKLSENDLALKLDISRPPLREAFRILEYEGLIFTIPRKGTYVSNISIEDLQDVYQAREMIECYAIDFLKAKNIKDLPQVELAVSSTSGLSTPSTNDPKVMLNYARDFANYHIKLVESTGNSEHRQILDLIKSGSYEKAKKSMREHLNGSFEFLKTKIPPSSVKRELPARQSLNNSSALERTLNREKEGEYIGERVFCLDPVIS